MTVMHDYTHSSFTDLAELALVELPNPIATIVPIRETGSRAPVFCVHPLDGLASRYGALAAHVDEGHPIYGMQTSTFGECVESLNVLASRYADEVHAAHDDGPVHLLGVEFGGVLAHAVAVALQQRGVVVDSLTLLDSSPTQRGGHVRHDLLAGMGDDVDRSRAEELLAIAVHNDALAEQHFPGVYVGRALVVSTAGSDAGAAWHPFVSGTVSKYEVSDAAAFELVGPLVDRHL